MPLLLAGALCVGGLGCDDGPKQVAASPVDAGAQREKVARLDKVDGPGILERDGKREASAPGPLYLGDAVETGTWSGAALLFSGGRVIELGPDGRVVIARDDTGLTLKVERGFVLSRVPAEPPSGGAAQELGDPTIGLSILTPFGITRVGTASEVKIALRADGATVDVMVGTVEVISRNGQRQAAEQGDSLTVNQGAVEFIRRGKRTIELAPVEVVLDVVTGRAEIKKKGQKAFKAVGKKPAPLEAGDTVRTLKNALAQLALADTGTRVGLRSNTEAVFEGAGKGEGVAESQLELKKGGVSLSLRRGETSRVKLGGLTVESEGGGQFTVERAGDGFDVTAAAGDAKIQREGAEPAQVRAGQRVRFSPQGAVVSSLQPADFELPSRPGLQVFHPGLDEVALTWEGGAKDYVVTVAEDAAFKAVLLAGLVHDGWVNAPLPSRGALHWKVETPDGKPVDRGSASFAPEPPVKDLERVRNEVPEGSEKTTIYYQDKPPAVTFVFGERPQAEQYRVTVFRTDDLSTPAVERTVSETAAPIEAGLLTEGSYRWAVTPLLKGGQEGEGGRMNKLDIVYDNSVPMVIVSAPRNGERATSKVPVRGVAPVDSKVYINGKAAPLDDKSRFEGTATPIGRSPIVVFRLTRASQPDVYTIRLLRRAR